MNAPPAPSPTSEQLLSARIARSAYWAALGEPERAAAEPTPQSLAAWVVAVRVARAALEHPEEMRAVWDRRPR